jgi:hypothetical protein
MLIALKRIFDMFSETCLESLCDEAFLTSLLLVVLYLALNHVDVKRNLRSLLLNPSYSDVDVSPMAA